MKGQPGPEDVTCGLFIGLGAMAAPLADEFRLGQAVLPGCMPAGFTAVGGVPGIDLYPYASSVFRFDAQNRDELPPASVTDTSVEPGLGRGPIRQEPSPPFRIGDRFGAADHVGDRQVLHHNQIMPLDKLTGGFVMKVAADVGNLAMQGGHRLAPASTAVGAALRVVEPPLCGRQLACGSPGPARILNVRTVGGGGEVGDAHIDTGAPPSSGQWISGYLVTGEDQHPVAALSADLDRLDSTYHLPVCGDLDVPDALQINAVGVPVPAGTVTVLGPLHTVKPASAFKPWISRLPTAFHPSEKTVESLIKPAQRGLLTRERPHRHIRASTTDLTQLGGLIPVADGGLAMRPGLPTLLQRRVVKLSMGFQTRRQSHVLARCRTHPKLVSPPHVDASHGGLMHSNRRTALAFLIRLRCSGRQPARRLSGITRPEQRRNRGSAMPEPYETPPTNPCTYALATSPESPERSSRHSPQDL